ncbi:MAG: DUF2087 domain-containing protein [Anaerolineae bacterium]|nr:DUF2087 domain-containing protein [Anaerolineae bacterium]
MNNDDFNAALGRLQPFLDGSGRLVQMPPARKIRRIALEYLASHFDFGRQYSEKQVNAMLGHLHTFSDAALLRRELVEAGYFGRQGQGEGARYWRTDAKTKDEQ